MVWAFVALAMFSSGSNSATKGLDLAAGLVVTTLWLLTGVPASVLAVRRRAPRTALVLSLLFPAALVVMFAAVVVALRS